MIAVVFCFHSGDLSGGSPSGQGDGEIVAFVINVYHGVSGYDGDSGHGLFDRPSRRRLL